MATVHPSLNGHGYSKNPSVIADEIFSESIWAKKSQSGKKLKYKPMINPKIPIYLAYFPFSKTPENNTRIAVRNKIIKTFIIYV